MTTTCTLCYHPAESHSTDEHGNRPCRSIDHPNGTPCQDCQKMLTAAYRDRVGAERETPHFEQAWAAYLVTLADIQRAFGPSAPAFFTDVHQSALASALIAYREQQETEQAIARVEAVCHELPYEYARLILDALENKEPSP